MYIGAYKTNVAENETLIYGMMGNSTDHDVRTSLCLGYYNLVSLLSVYYKSSGCKYT